MTINKRGGKGHKRGKKMTASQVSTALTYKDPTQGQEYAKVLGTQGDCRLSIQLLGVDPLKSYVKDVTKPVICKVPGAFRKKVYANKGDYVLVAIRDYQIDHADVITIYSHSEALTLMKQGEIPMDDGVNTDHGSAEIDIVNDDSAAPTTNETSNNHIRKDDDWYNSLLPPTDSDDENPDNHQGGSLNDQKNINADKTENKPKVRFTLSSLNRKLNDDDDEDNDDAEKQEEIDLETL